MTVGNRRQGVSVEARVKQVASAALVVVVVLSGCSGATPPSDSVIASSAEQPSPPRLDQVPPPDGSSSVPIPAEFVRVSAEGLVVRVVYPDLCQELLGVHTEETAASVHIVAVASPQAEFCQMRASSGEYEVPLDAPLGDRAVTSR